MRVSFDISASSGGYPVVIGEGLLEEVIAAPGEKVFIVDERLSAPLIDAGADPIVIVANEDAKSLDRMTDLVTELRRRGTNRGTELVVIGGGVLQDAGAFAASVYMRGLTWRYMPTTLLGMADSCIGGKSSINVGQFKNIVGTIHPPADVLIDPALTATLSREQRAAGLCEAAKICLCRGPEVFDAYLALEPSVDGDPENLGRVIELSLRTKKWFVEIDEFDRAERLNLNFGHTFGHAIEAASGFRVTHGIAVGLGMMAAIDLGRRIMPDVAQSAVVSRFLAHIDQLLTTANNLPQLLAELRVADLMAAFDADKKHSRERFAVILVDPQGVVERRLLPRSEETVDAIRSAFQSLLSTTREAPLAA